MFSTCLHSTCIPWAWSNHKPRRSTISVFVRNDIKLPPTRLSAKSKAIPSNQSWYLLHATTGTFGPLKCVTLAKPHLEKSRFSSPSCSTDDSTPVKSITRTSWLSLFLARELYIQLRSLDHFWGISWLSFLSILTSFCCASALQNPTFSLPCYVKQVI